MKVRVLTNSLASNNVLAAQAGHAKHRAALIDAGMDLYELRPKAESVMQQVAPQGHESVTTLHTKALAIDGKPQTWSKDPETSGFKRFKEGIIEILPIQNRL